MDYEKALEKARSAYGTGAYDDATLEFLFPQLKESEDERIRKEIISIVKAYRENCIDEGTHRFDDCLVWLEKQKEQKPWKVGANAYFTPEQKPAEINVKALLAADRLASAEMTGRLKERSEILENPEKYGLQKPAEWSEENEDMLEEIINHIDTTSVQRIPARPGSAIGKSWIKFLKSLHPQPKQEWSEEDDQLIGFIFDLLNDLVWRKDWAMSKEECLERLKSLRPSWKPSEEQMGALSWMLENARGNIDFDPLKDLYEQLKKLM